MILDTYSEVFVWIGRGANELEKKEGLKTAQEYVGTDPSDRDLDSTTLIQVRGVRYAASCSSACPQIPNQNTVHTY